MLLLLGKLSWDLISARVCTCCSCQLSILCLIISPWSSLCLIRSQTSLKHNWLVLGPVLTCCYSSQHPLPMFSGQQHSLVMFAFICYNINIDWLRFIDKITIHQTEVSGRQSDAVTNQWAISNKIYIIWYGWAHQSSGPIIKNTN